MWQLIDDNPDTGLKKYTAPNPDDDDGVLVRYEQSGQAIDSVLDRNKALANDASGPLGDFVHAASIPVGVMYEWKKRYGVDAWRASTDPDQAKAVRRLLNDPEWRYLRVRHFIM